MKARKLKKESSSVGLAGIIKKLGYWIVIATAFLTAFALTALEMCIRDRNRKLEDDTEHPGMAGFVFRRQLPHDV